jgi:hypothetical protein
MRRKNYKFQKEEFEDEDEEMSQEEVENEEIEGEEEEESSEDSEAVIYQSEDKQENDGERDERVTQEDKETFNSYLYDVRKNIDELNNKLSFLNHSLESEKAEMGYGISYLDAKNNMMMVYLTNLIMYSIAKMTGTDIDDSKTVKKLIHIKTIMERSKVIDLKLKSQIDRLIKLSDKDITAVEEVSKENLRVIKF